MDVHGRDSATGGKEGVRHRAVGETSPRVFSSVALNALGSERMSSPYSDWESIVSYGSKTSGVYVIVKVEPQRTSKKCCARLRGAAVFDAITFSYFQGARGQNTYSSESWVNDSLRRSAGYGRRLGPT